MIQVNIESKEYLNMVKETKYITRVFLLLLSNYNLLGMEY